MRYIIFIHITKSLNYKKNNIQRNQSESKSDSEELVSPVIVMI